MLNPTVLIPTPLGLFIVKIFGEASLKFLAFSLILTLETPPFLISASRITFLIWFPVIASITTRDGLELYPLPPEVIPILEKEFNSSILKISGVFAITLSVGSVG